MKSNPLISHQLVPHCLQVGPMCLLLEKTQCSWGGNLLKFPAAAPGQFRQCLTEWKPSNCPVRSGCPWRVASGSPVCFCPTWTLIETTTSAWELRHLTESANPRTLCGFHGQNVSKFVSVGEIVVISHW